MAMVEYITDQGKEMLAQSLAGKITITFTKIQIGDGTLPTGQSRKTMEALVNLVTEIQVYRTRVTDENVVQIMGIFDNSAMTSGFYFREKGVFASDGTNEILFAYANSGTSAEYINPPTVESVEKQIISLYTNLQDTDTEVHITVASGIYALYDDLEKITDIVYENQDMIGKNVTNILALDIALSLLQGAVVAGTSDNIFVETFEDDSSIRIACGIYDSVNKRMYA